jgi:hypothetical protein
VSLALTVGVAATAPEASARAAIPRTRARTQES